MSIWAPKNVPKRKEIHREQLTLQTSDFLNCFQTYAAFSTAQENHGSLV